jgi:hypothetical protein
MPKRSQRGRTKRSPSKLGLGIRMTPAIPSSANPPAAKVIVLNLFCSGAGAVASRNDLRASGCQSAATRAKKLSCTTAEASAACALVRERISYFMRPNDMLERHAVAQARNEADLFQSSTPSLVQRRCAPRSLESLVRQVHRVSAPRMTHEQSDLHQQADQGTRATIRRRAAADAHACAYEAPLGRQRGQWNATNSCPH